MLASRMGSKRRRSRAQAELGYAGLALLRAWPFGDRTDLIHEMASALASDTWAGDEVEVTEYELGPGYSRWAETYDSLPNPLIRIEQSVIQPLIESLPPGRVLDVACGTGRISALLAARGLEVIGVDASVQMLARLQRARPDVDVCVADVLRLPFKDASVDAVVCALAAAHFEHLDELLSELARVVEPSGRVLLTDIHPIAVATGAHAFFQDAAGARGVVRNFVHWHSDYIAAFNAAGLSIRGCYEPRVDDEMVELLAPTMRYRKWISDALLELPLALIWDLERDPS